MPWLQGQLKEAQATLESLISKKIEIDRQKENAARMLSYWREQAEKFRTAFKESEKQTESALEQQRQDHKAALLTLRQQIQIFDSTIADLEEQLTSATWEKQVLQTTCDGKYTDKIRQCCMALLSHNVGIHHIHDVTRNVFRLPVSLQNEYQAPPFFSRCYWKDVQ